jgi:hypothetical protein
MINIPITKILFLDIETVGGCKDYQSCITSNPRDVTPAEKASASCGEDGRISWPITIVPGSRSCIMKRAKAAPVAKVKSGVNSDPTKPRMSYALKILGALVEPME